MIFKLYSASPLITIVYRTVSNEMVLFIRVTPGGLDGVNMERKEKRERRGSDWFEKIKEGGGTEKVYKMNRSLSLLGHLSYFFFFFLKDVPWM